jgi:predicted permease
MRAALYAYPREFRVHFGDEILADSQVDPTPTVTQVLDVIRNGVSMRVEGTIRDLAYALRRLRAAPLFVAIVVGTFALGIGANIAVFSVLNGVILRPLPYASASHVVLLGSKNPRREMMAAMSIPDTQDVRAQTHALVSIAAGGGDEATVLGHGKPEAIDGIDVMPGYFEILGVTPQLGRTISADDVRPGVHNVVISDALWRRDFNADPSAIGQVLNLDGTRFRIVGVLRPGQQLVYTSMRPSLESFDFVEALAPTAAAHERGSRYLLAIASLAPGVTATQANAELALISKRLQRQFPDLDTGLEFSVVPLDAAILGPAASALWIIFFAVIGVLVIACTNVANVIGARWSVRDREIALRRALGASSARIASQLLVETGLLAAAGGIVGIGLAAISLRTLGAQVLRGLPRAGDVHLDGLSLGYALAIVVVAALLAGLSPMLSLMKSDLQLVLKSAGRGGDASAGHGVRSALVVVEIALTLAVVIVSVLVLRSFGELVRTPLGISPNGVVVSGFAVLSDTEYPNLDARAAMQRSLLTRLRALPGADTAALTVQYPLSDFSLTFDTAVFGAKYANGDEPTASGNDVSPAYFATLGIPLLRGRDFAESDSTHSSAVAIVNTAFVTQILDGRSPLGTRVRVAGWNGTVARWATIVGVVGDTRGRLDAPPLPTLYSPIAQAPASMVAAVVRGATTAPDVLGREMQGAFAASAPLLQPPDTFTMARRLEIQTRAARATATLLGVLSLIALLLALTGIFGVVSFTVTQRSREFGIRVALGARSGAVLADVLRRTLLTTAVGIGCGLVLAGLAARAVAPQLYAVSPFDPVSFVAVVALLSASACAAALQPAIRATRVDPVVALRYE